MQQESNPTLWQTIKSYFNVLPEKNSRIDVITQITDGISFHGANFWILIFAILIASLGLNVNSTAVIIGAMLISPLMGPIIGMGLGLGIADLDLFKHSIKNYLISTFISVVTATIYFTLTPITDAQSEILARTSPTLYDVLIALFGGAAGFLAMATTKGKSNVIPGVAIATALMPPLCTAGYGLAVQNTSYFFGAFYLYFINTVFITFTTCLGVRLLRFKRKKSANRDQMKRVNLYIVSILIITIIPASYMTWNIIEQSVFENNVEEFITKELNYRGTNILSHEYDSQTKTLRVIAVGNPISTNSIKKAEKTMDAYELNGYKLKVIQGNPDSLLILQNKMKGQLMTGEKNTAELQELAYNNDVLKKKLTSYTRYPVLANDMREELKVVCPSAKSIMLSKASESFVDSASIKNYIVAIVKTNKPLAKDNRKQLYDWLKVKVKSDSLELIVLP